MDSLTRASGSRGGFDKATLDLLHAVGVSESDVDGLVRRVLTTALTVLPCEHPLLLLRTNEDGIRLYTALDDGAVIGMPFGETGTILAAALAEPRLVVEGDLEGRPEAGPVLGRMFEASSLAVAPLRAGAETIGLVGVVDPHEAPFSPASGAILELLATRTAASLVGLQAQDALRSEVSDAEFLLDRLFRADQNKTELLSIVSHEVKGPVTNIIGFGKVLLEQDGSLPSERRAHFLDVIVKEGERAARLVEDILDLARVESGALGCDLRPARISDIIADVLAANVVLCEKHSIEVDLAHDLPAVSADADRIGQVIRNLLSNACSYSPAGSTVVIRAMPIRDDQGRSVLVSVTDQGPGIPEEEHDGIFQKFRRLSSGNGSRKGSGLGLFVSHGIVTAHGGRIWVKSRPGDGATFYFTLQPAH